MTSIERRISRCAWLRLRYTASVVSVAIAGYLSLGTSCISDRTSRSASLTFDFEPGQASTTLVVELVGSHLQVKFDQLVDIPVRWPATDLGLGGGMSIGGASFVSSSDEENAMVSSRPLVPSDPDGGCWRLDARDEDGMVMTCSFGAFDGIYEARAPERVELRVFRSEESAATRVNMSAHVSEYGSCNGDPPDRIAITVSEKRP